MNYGLNRSDIKVNEIYWMDRNSPMPVVVTEITEGGTIHFEYVNKYEHHHGNDIEHGAISFHMSKDSKHSGLYASLEDIQEAYLQQLKETFKNDKEYSTEWLERLKKARS